MVALAVLALGGPAPAAGQEAKPAHAMEQITNSIGMKLTRIPAGEFLMGSGESADETAAFFQKTYGWTVKGYYIGDDRPQHRVRITRPFYLGTYHVTRGQFRRFVEEAGYKTDAEKDPKGGRGMRGTKAEYSPEFNWRNTGFPQTDEHPVVIVSWNDAVAFCQWLSRKEGKTYRLPTEAEWEYACRAGTTTRYSSGDDPETLVQVANVADATFAEKFSDSSYHIRARDGYLFTAPVGQFRPNAFGLYDMHGNASQWCADRYGANYYAASPVADPAGPDSGNVRVIRGGSWGVWPVGARSADRKRDAPDDRMAGMGFRVARTD
jgi:formylglycine-generating enzyme required for sulfatase activity